MVNRFKGVAMRLSLSHRDDQAIADEQERGVWCPVHCIAHHADECPHCAAGVVPVKSALPPPTPIAFCTCLPGRSCWRDDGFGWTRCLTCGNSWKEENAVNKNKDET